MAQDTLKKYRSKRVLNKSGEPEGRIKKSNKEPIFTIQKHNASHLHYDFRLEVNGVMPSWAVPKGPSLNPAIKRLAVMTEDHPLDYARFEGVIPEGNYGAGQVIVWDFGTYENIKHDRDGKLIPLAECIKKGTVEIYLHGNKLQGGYALVRTHLDNGKDWLLIKMKDEHAHARRNPVSTQQESALSGITIEDLKHSNNKKKSAKQVRDSTKKMKHKIQKKSDSNNDKHEVEVAITHPEKIIFPPVRGDSHNKSGIKKQEFVDYYTRIAPTMLPYLAGRPISMQRFVDGIDAPGFYQKEAGSYFPDYINRVTVKKTGGVVHEVIVDNEQSLIYLANQLVITFHRWLSKAKKINHPDSMIFDLDPSNDDDFGQVRKTALMLKKVMEKLDLVPYVMTTGSKGLHVVIPLTGDATFDQVKKLARDIAQIMVEGDDAHLTIELRKDQREDKIFVDYLRNGFSATAVAPYSVRPRDHAPVAMPILWSEVSKKSLKPDQFTIDNVFKRLERVGDVWKNMHKDARSAKKAIKKLNDIIKEHDE